MRWNITIESGCADQNSPAKIVTKSLRHCRKNTSWCRIGKWLVWKLVVSRPKLVFFDTLDESFQKTSRVTAESAGALRDGANVVRTATGNNFWVQICYEFPEWDCRWDWDLCHALFGYLRFVTCEKRTVEHKQLPGKNAFRPQSDLACSAVF